MVNEMEDLYTFMGSANSVLEQRVGDEGADAEAEGEDAEPEELPEGVDPAELRKEKEKEVCTDSKSRTFDWILVCTYSCPSSQCGRKYLCTTGHLVYGSHQSCSVQS